MVGIRWEGKLINHDQRLICSVFAGAAPFNLPPTVHLARFEKAEACGDLGSMPSFEIRSKGKRDIYEWKKFMEYLSKKRVAVIELRDHELFIQNLEEPGYFAAASVAYRKLAAAVERSVSAQMHPKYLTTLSQTHAGWAFGAIAELIDNARDAKARRLNITIERGTLMKDRSDIPMLTFLDNGIGMTHEEIMRMVTFGHEGPNEDDPNQVGRFGVGFKTGAMRLGKDAVVFTQSRDTRSIALLSASYNEGKQVLEVPVVTYMRHAGRMDIDTRVQAVDAAKVLEKAITTFSPFDQFGIGSQFAKLGAGTGTLIYIYNLENRGSGSSFSLDWDEEKDDILIRSKRVRTRPGQTSQDVPLDFSLRSYMELLFLEPRMISYIQGKQVKSKCLAKSLHNTKVATGLLLGKSVQLTLGRCEQELQRSNCGMFLYWHGRLIEAYKRVGNMVHSADWGRGVVGVVETTSLMDFKNGQVGVLNNKQGFEDTDVYAALEKWLGKEADQYWETYGENLAVEDREGFPLDMDWVQCNSCLKWRALKPEWNVDKDSLPDEWFCYLPPYSGNCKTPEEQVKPGVVTVKTKRGRGDSSGCTDASKAIVEDTITVKKEPGTTKEPATRTFKKRVKKNS